MGPGQLIPKLADYGLVRFRSAPKTYENFVVERQMEKGEAEGGVLQMTVQDKSEQPKVEMTPFRQDMMAMGTILYELVTQRIWNVAVPAHKQRGIRKVQNSLLSMIMGAAEGRFSCLQLRMHLEGFLREIVEMGKDVTQETDLVTGRMKRFPMPVLPAAEEFAPAQPLSTLTLSAQSFYFLSGSVMGALSHFLNLYATKTRYMGLPDLTKRSYVGADLPLAKIPLHVALLLSRVTVPPPTFFAQHSEIQGLADFLQLLMEIEHVMGKHAAVGPAVIGLLSSLSLFSGVRRILARLTFCGTTIITTLKRFVSKGTAVRFAVNCCANKDIAIAIANSPLPALVISRRSLVDCFLLGNLVTHSSMTFDLKPEDFEESCSFLAASLRRTIDVNLLASVSKPQFVVTNPPPQEGVSVTEESVVSHDAAAPPPELESLAIPAPPEPNLAIEVEVPLDTTTAVEAQVEAKPAVAQIEQVPEKQSPDTTKKTSVHL